MQVSADNSYPKFNHYRTYAVSVDASTTLDWSDNLPADPCYFVGFYAGDYRFYGISSEAGDTSVGTSIYSASGDFVVLSPIKCRTLLLKNAQDAVNTFYFVLAWN